MCSVASGVDLGAQSLAVNSGDVGVPGRLCNLLLPQFLSMQNGDQPHSAVRVY